MKTWEFLAAAIFAVMIAVGVFTLARLSFAPDPSDQARWQYFYDSKIAKICRDGTRVMQGPDGRFYVAFSHTKPFDSADVCN